MTLPIVDSGTHERPVSHEKVDDVVVRFAGDSGDGMQLTGSQFTTTIGPGRQRPRDLPRFPCRDPRAGGDACRASPASRSASPSHDIHTPGDAPDVLVAMNPAALKVNLRDLKPNGILIVNTDASAIATSRRRATTRTRSRTTRLDAYRVFEVAARDADQAHAWRTAGLDAKAQDRCKNFFALGMIYWLYTRPLDATIDWLDKKFAAKPRARRRRTSAS